MRTKIACVAVMVLFLSACGGSGSGGGAAGGEDASCTGSACGTDNDPGAAPEEPTRAVPPDAPPTKAPDEPLACAGSDAASCPDGYHCVDNPLDDCMAANGSLDCGGICVLGEELPRCGTLEDDPCPEGYVCSDDPRDACAGGPAVDCSGVCRPRADGQCSTDADCPVIDAVCSVCADGSVSCPISRCDAGRCTVDFKPCSEAQVCGGLSGLSCDPGFKCVDDPTDSCGANDGNADCRGICVPDQQPPECGGVAGITCPPGFTCTDDPNDMCDPADGGADCPGVCRLDAGECASNDDCPPVPGPCSFCPDGSESCARSSCVNGRCAVNFPTCPLPPGCATDTDCPPGQICANATNEMCDGNDPATGCIGFCIPDSGPPSCGGISGETCPDGYACVDENGDDCNPDDGGADCKGICRPVPPAPCATDEECASDQVCSTCPDGTVTCSSNAVCRDGQCVPVDPPCGENVCRDDASCAVPQVCEMCPDGSFSCARGECQNGMCVAVYPGCNGGPGFCGGIAGFPCPPGYACVDDPGDECDPDNGGADCGGKCVRQEEPPKCGGGVACPDGYECVPVEGDDCDPATGSDCSSMCRLKPGGACASDADCPQALLPCPICADGTTACPRTSCTNGQCKTEFASCGGEQPPQPGGVD